MSDIWNCIIIIWNWITTHVGLIAGFIASSTAIIVFVRKTKDVIIKAITEPILKGVQKNSEALTEHILSDDKTYLTDFLSEVDAGEPKTQIQVQRAYEIKKEYNELGGDSYVDDKWEEAIKVGKLKL